MSRTKILDNLNSDTSATIDSGRRYRVVHLHSTLGVYGAERWTMALLKHLESAKFESFVISIGTKPGADSFYQLLTTEGLTAYHIPIPGKLNPRAIWALRRVMQQKNVDILHTHGFKADVLGYLATRGISVRLVSTIHGWSADEGFRIRIYEAISRLFLKKFDRIYPLSPVLLEHLRQKSFDPSKLHLVLNSVDLSGQDFGFTPRRSRDPFSIIFVGRLCRPKGVYDLLEAFSLAQFKATTRLMFVGDGGERAKLEEFSRRLGVEGRVTFTGEVPSIARFLSKSNALVLPSYSEGIPRVIMEAFAAGVPVIGTSIPGITQLIDDEITGLLTPVGDTNHLAHSLERLCVNPDLAQYMATNARRVVLDKYSARRMANDLHNEYKRLCEVS